MNFLKNKLIINTIHLYLLTIVKMVLPLITLPYLARTLSTNAYGIVTYVKAWMQYMQLIIDFGFLLSATKMIVLYRNDQRKIGNVIGDTVVEKLLLSFLAFIVLIIASLKVEILNTNLHFSILFYFSIFLTIFHFDFLFRGIEEMEKLSIPLIISKIFTTLLTYIFVKSDTDIYNLAYLEIIGNLVAAIISIYFILEKKYVISLSNWTKWLKDIKKSFTYFLSNFSTTIFGVLTTIITGIVLTTTEVAIWGVCMQFVNAVKSIYSPIINSLYPYMINKKDIKTIYKINKIMLFPIITGVLFDLLFAEDLIHIIAGDKYMQAAIIMKFLIPVFSISFYSMIYGWPVLGAINKDKQTTITTVLASIIQISLLTLLITIDKFNLITLAISIGISEVSLFLFRYILYERNKNLFYNGE